MKSIFNVILIAALTLSLGLGWGIMAQPQSQVAKAVVAETGASQPTLTVTSAPATGAVAIEAWSACGVASAQASGLNLNQSADCFTIHLASTQALPELVVASQVPTPSLVIAQGPVWSPDQMAQNNLPQASPVAALTFVVIAILLYSSIRVTKRLAVRVGQGSFIQPKLSLAELQVYRC